MIRQSSDGILYESGVDGSRPLQEFSYGLHFLVCLSLSLPVPDHTEFLHLPTDLSRLDCQSSDTRVAFSIPDRCTMVVPQFNHVLPQTEIAPSRVTNSAGEFKSHCAAFWFFFLSITLRFLRGAAIEAFSMNYPLKNQRQKNQLSLPLARFHARSGGRRGCNPH